MGHHRVLGDALNAWTPGFVYDLTEEAWRGDINGRRGLLTHEKTLIMQTTPRDDRSYDTEACDGEITSARLIHSAFGVTLDPVAGGAAGANVRRHRDRR